jgi:cell division septum initiation protein DivIVA
MIEIKDDQFDNINKFQNSLESLRFQNKINELYAENNKINCKKLKLENDIKHLEKINNELEKNNLILKKEIADLKRIIQESNDSKDYLTSKIKSESTICSDLRKLNLKLKEERDELMNNKNNLVNEISDLKKVKMI